MKKQFLVLAIVLTTVVWCGVSCSKEEDNLKEGTITGYVKSAGYYSGSQFIDEDIFGVYLLSAVRDSFLTFNIPESTLNSLLGMNIESLSYGDRKISKINISIVFSYRKAKETEFKRAAISKEVASSNLLQVVVTEIEKSRAQPGGGSDGIPSCCQ